MARVIFLIRHGAVRDDGARRFIGRTDVVMSEAGEAQIRKAAAALAAFPLDGIYCSNLKRSCRTAELLAADRNTPIHVWPAFAEIDMGTWEGRLRGEVAESHADAYAARGRDIVRFRPPEGESFADLADRVLPVWRRLVASGDQTIAIAGHAGVNRVILCDVLGMPLADLFHVPQEPGCLTRIVFERHERASVIVERMAVLDVNGRIDRIEVHRDRGNPGLARVTARAHILAERDI